MAIVRINGIKFSSDLKPKELFSEIITLFPNIQYWSYDALCKLYLGVKSLIKEISEYFVIVTKGKEKASFTRYLNKDTFKNKATGERYRKKIILPKSRNGILNKIYENVLSGYGNPLMRNIGLANNFGDSLNINSEKQSMIDIKPKEDEEINKLLKVEEKRNDYGW